MDRKAENLSRLITGGGDRGLVWDGVTRVSSVSGYHDYASPPRPWMASLLASSG